MKPKTFILIFLVTACLTGAVTAQTDNFNTFKSDYGLVDLDLLNNPGEVCSVEDFVYKKDVATFTFEEGIIYLLRYIQGRPTTAIFIGKGRAYIEIPSHLEKNNLRWCSRDSVVNEKFEVCLIRIADDFDLKLREKYTFEQKQLSWKHFNIAKKAQGEFFFKPHRDHEYDNYFQLLRSIYERREDGYFWVDFNRYVFNFDPNRPEEVIVAYEHEGGDIIISEAAVFQRREKETYDNSRMSDITYPTTMLDREGSIYMGGLDGKRIDSTRINVQVLVNADSLRFVSLFLHYNLKCDSIYYENQPLSCWRRNDFSFIGTILPAYRYKGDTLHFTFRYSGRDYRTFLPFVENPQATPHNLTFYIPGGYNYLMPGMSEYKAGTGKERIITIEPTQPFQNFYFQPYASGYDTIPKVTDIGLTVNFLNSKEINKNRFTCYLPDNTFQTTILTAFDFLSSHLGMPPGTFEVFVYPEDTFRNNLSMPGLVEVPQVFCAVEGTGGLYTEAGYQVARQWFGSLMQPKSYREKWLTDAPPAYLTIMLLQSVFDDPAISYTELLHLKDRLLINASKNEDLPLAAVRRLNEQIRLNKGAWIIHMLRFLMYDLKTHSDKTFWRFLHEFSVTGNNQPFTNTDFIRLAEKHYGQPLDWFFKKWLYDLGVPEYEGEYTFIQKSDGFYVEGTVRTKNMADDYNMPVIIRIEDTGGQSSFHRRTIPGTGGTFSIGPLAEEPATFYFNEFFSVLSKDKVKKK